MRVICSVHSIDWHRDASAIAEECSHFLRWGEED